MEIIEGNKLIAEFMGWEAKYHPVETIHTSWDWLMPVVEKIEQIGYPVKIQGDYYGDNGVLKTECTVFGNDGDYLLTSGAVEVKIGAVWQAVVEFINWHNQSK